MRATASLIRREFSAYFLSPIAYVVMAAFLAGTGVCFAITLSELTATGPEGVEFPLQLMLGDGRFWLAFSFIPALLTMRLLAEERSTGTLEMLMTVPLRDWQVVLAKYVASFGFYLFMWLPTLLYLTVILRAKTAEGYLDAMPVLSSALGLTLAGAMFLAVGLLVSSFVRSQLISAIVSLLISLCFVVSGFWRPEVDAGSFLERAAYFFSVPLHFQRYFSRGIVDTRPLVLYISVTLFALFLTVRSLESRRWR